MTRQLALDALDMAVAARRPARGLLHHTDRGSQYASAECRAALDANGFVCSMSRKGNCWDNAVAESFFASLKKELVHDTVFFSRDIARAHVFEYIEIFYNGNDGTPPSTTQPQAILGWPIHPTLRHSLSVH